MKAERLEASPSFQARIIHAGIEVARITDAIPDTVSLPGTAIPVNACEGEAGAYPDCNPESCRDLSEGVLEGSFGVARSADGGFAAFCF